MGLKFTQVDAFTDTPFAGNPAAVCILPEPAEARWMQLVAREMNLAETAFLYRQEERASDQREREWPNPERPSAPGQGPGGFNLRWFTPAVEVDLCGHATLASAHALWEEGHLSPDAPARFYTRSGLLTCVRRGAWIEMDFPATPAQPADAPADLARALGAQPLFVGQSQFDYLVEIESEETVRSLAPDLTLLARIPTRGVIVTSRASTPEHDVVSRFFAPQVGVNEDPVTGSAHCCLGPYWSERLGKSELTAYQASARGGVVRVRVQGERVILGGQAVTVLRGELLA